MTAVDDPWRTSVVPYAREQITYNREWSLCRGESNSLESTSSPSNERSESLNRDGQVSATLVACERVNLINDDGLDIRERRTPLW